ncbi:DJ-1/PfpI family protein [Streptomyces sp. NPDC050508]|uniref:DJ-1/PfpI family protein n=1 Tax=Streptomyces sp. NPDC050508 TaxID=3155405 RepID=UPI0034479F06
MSIRSGAFALAEAGLLDGRPATTHWQVSDQLQRRCPSFEVQPNRMFVDDGDILTSA